MFPKKPLIFNFHIHWFSFKKTLKALQFSHFEQVGFATKKTSKIRRFSNYNKNLHFLKESPKGEIGFPSKKNYQNKKVFKLQAN
jgi:hypothetical protein